jgi:hypothetical protein
MRQRGCVGPGLPQQFRALVCVLVIALTVAGLAKAQTRPTVKLLASDQSSLTLSNNFGVPAQADVNQAGDYAFAGADASALFFRSATAATTTRLLQRNDSVPGSPGVQSDILQPFRLNNTGHIAVQVAYVASDPKQNGSAILMYDGSAFHTVVTSADPAAGSSGRGLEHQPGIRWAGHVRNQRHLLESDAGLLNWQFSSGRQRERACHQHDQFCQRRQLRQHCNCFRE